MTQMTPQTCKSGAALVHTHYRDSPFWPLDGVNGKKRRYARTSVYRNLDMLLRVNRCSPDTTAVRNDETGLSHTTWAYCTDGGPVEFMVLDEAFAFQDWWLDEMLDRIERPGVDRPFEVQEEPLANSSVFKTPGTETGFKAAGTGTGFKTPGTGTGFKAPGTGTGSHFKPAK